MNVIDDAALQAAGQTLITQFQAAIDEAIDRATKQITTILQAANTDISNTVQSAATCLEGTETKLFTDLKALDGWTLTITPGPITVRLNKPKE